MGHFGVRIWDQCLYIYYLMHEWVRVLPGPLVYGACVRSKAIINGYNKCSQICWYGAGSKSVAEIMVESAAWVQACLSKIACLHLGLCRDFTIFYRDPTAPTEALLWIDAKLLKVDTMRGYLFWLSC